MQERANKFIEILENEDLLSPEILDELRKQVSESKTKLKPELLAKLLVDNGHLTKFQATKLIAGMTDAVDAPAASADIAPADSADELTFADSNSAATPVEAVEVEAVETVPVVESVEAVESVEVIQTVGSVGTAEAVQAIPAGMAESDSEDGVFDTPKASPKVVRPPSPDNPWDSMRILGRGVALALILIIGAALVWYFAKGSADETLTRAENAYEQRSYESAADIYQQFSDKWPAHEKASFAKVRSVLARIRKDSEGAPDPKIGLDMAAELLPTIADESGLATERADLTGVLVSLASKFVDRADSRETTAERKELMGELGRLMGMINDPKFVGQAEKEANRVTLNEIKESEKRINYEIGRDETLAATLEKIDKLLDGEDTEQAFAERDLLTNTYPFLEANEALQERILRACEIQKSQVADGSLVPSPSKQDPEPALGNSFILGNTDGDKARDLRGKTLFVRAKGAVYGLAGETGEILWQRHVGRGFDSDPIRLEGGRSTDALICVPAKGQVIRVAGETGEVKWFVDFKTKIHTPVQEGQDLFVASHEGDVVSLDLNSGQVIWSKKLPQPLSVAPGLAFGRDKLYLPAMHTSLYVLSRSDGECKEVKYLGHRPGAIAVPPVLLLGQLFVFENNDTNVAKIRLFTVSPDDGLNLTESQVPIPIEGNVVVPADTARRRVLVQSDLGHILALDIEVSAETDKVSADANRAKNVLQPQMSWLLADESNVWTTDTRLSSLDLQVSMQRFKSNWSKYDGDRFTGPPSKFDDTLVYSRTQRGNRGVRVAAADAKTGREIWTTDLSVPIAMLDRAGSQLRAINTSGMYYALTKPGVASSATFNAGKDRISLNFDQMVALGDDSAVLFNSSVPNQLAMFDGGELELVSANFGGAALSAPPTAVGDKVAVALDSGQFVLLNPSNGTPASSPYQMPMKPGQKIQWNRPVYLESANTLIVANDKLKLARLTAGDNLRALTQVDLESPFVGPIVELGKSVAAVVSLKSGDNLTTYNPTSLKAAAKIALKGRLLSGPYSLESGCLVQTDAGLQLISEEAKEIWSLKFPNAALVGPPTETGGRILLATATGQIWSVNASDGNVVANLDSGYTFSSNPIVVSPERIIVGSDEGTVLALPMPSSPTIQ